MLLIKEPYIPGDLTEEKDRDESHDLLKGEDIFEPKHPTGFPQYKNLPSRKESLENIFSDSNTSMDFCKIHKIPKSDAKDVRTFLDTAKNFQLAKELHKVNLEHEPLPDTVPDKYFRKMQMEEPQRNPGLAIKGNNFASAIGWKGYTGFGANRCTKLKIFRPKTSGDIKTTIEEHHRPNSVGYADKKWRFIRQNKVTPIELAICWDLTPVNADDEPKRPVHIDGSNESQGPAVFSMVHTPKRDEENERNEPSSGRNMPAVFSTVQHQEYVQKVGDDYEKYEHGNVRPKTTNHCEKEHDLHRAKSAYDLKYKESPITTASSKKSKFHQSTPNVSISSCSKNCCTKFNTRLCVACELKNMPEKKKKPKEEYKMAFKAGNPNSRSTSSSGSQATVKVPKQKDPYSRKNYAINSLAPPFRLQKDKREEYPDHWRLASVYQHSYKPIQLRKKPLLQSVFK